MGEPSSTSGFGPSVRTNAHVGVDLDSAAFFDLLVERIGRLG